MTTSEPTTGEIVRAFRGAGVYGITTALELKIIDRLESQERELVRITDELTALTARAEQAEAREKAAVADMKLIVDAVREEYSDETCCFACKYDIDTSCDECGCCPGECPGFESNDCFEWRGLPQEGEGL